MNPWRAHSNHIQTIVHTFWYVIFIFSFVKNFLNFPSDFFVDPLTTQEHVIYVPYICTISKFLKFLLLISSFIPCGQRRCMLWLGLSWIFWDLLFGPTNGVSNTSFHMLMRMCILQFLDKMFCKCLFSLEYGIV
jgi:hypothetical protein